MNVKASKLGKSDGENIDIVNLKCAPEVIETLVLDEAGIYPAYHMSKAHWLTVTLDGTVVADKLKFLLEMSYDLTKGNKK